MIPAATRQPGRRSFESFAPARCLPLAARRPDAATYDAVASHLEAKLDAAAKIEPNPGRLPLFHRLTRTEYKNAIRDLLALDDLSKDVDLDLLLPADNSSSGFDNIADLLFVSSTQLEQYLSAAQKLSAVAVGDQSLPPLVDVYRMSDQFNQEYQAEGAPFGTRGGTVIRTYLPLDGEYRIHIELADVPREPHQLEIAVDDERVRLISAEVQTAPTAAEAETARKRRGIARCADRCRETGRDCDRDQDQLGRQPPVRARSPQRGPSKGARQRFRCRCAVEGGPARDRGDVPQAHVGERRSAHSAAAARKRAVAGYCQRHDPWTAEDCGSWAIRRAAAGYSSARPPAAAEELGCAKKILSSLARRAYRRPVNDADLQTLLSIYEAERGEGGFEAGIKQGLERILVSPQFLFRIERQPAKVAPGAVYRISDLELASRLSFFLWSSIPDDELLDLAMRGKLSDRAVLEQQVRRMLRDPRSEALATNFAAQWLYLRDMDAKTPSPRLFPDFDLSLREPSSVKRPCSWKAFSAKIAASSICCSANDTFMNERLAKHYGVPNVFGNDFRRVTYPDDNPRRGLGLLGHSSILTITSYANRTSPVLRGKYVLGESPRRAAGAAAAEHSGAGHRKQGFRQGPPDAGSDGAASRESRMRELPRRDGSDWLCAGQLRRAGTAGGRSMRRALRSTPRACCRMARGSKAWPDCGRFC